MRKKKCSWKYNKQKCTKKMKSAQEKVFKGKVSRKSDQEKSLKNSSWKSNQENIYSGKWFGKSDHERVVKNVQKSQSLCQE